MKRAPFQYGIVENADQKHYFRSIDEYTGTAEFQEALAREFPAGASEMDPDSDENGFTRRNFLKVMGASIALAGATGCRRPEEKILPYSHAPEEIIPGKPQFYATSVPWNGTAVGLLIESHGGRPTKIEGNPLHTESGGGTNAFIQAMILSLYDPDRSVSPQQKGTAKTWEDAIHALTDRTDKLKSAGGKGFAILAEPSRSPTLDRLLTDVKKAMPQAQIVEWDVFANEASDQATAAIFGGAADVIYKLDAAGAVLALDADFLQTETGALRNSLAFVSKRRLNGPQDNIENRLYSVESQFSVTGASADHRLRLPSRNIAGVLGLVAKELVAGGLAIGADLSKFEARAATLKIKGLDKFVKGVAKDLATNKGVIVPGRTQPAAVHALAHAINLALKAPVEFQKRDVGAASVGTAALLELTTAMKSGSVDTLLILGGNPAFNAPADAAFVEALSHVQASFHLGEYYDETGAATTWHLNRAHFLETWGDTISVQDQLSIAQPLIAPLHGGRSDIEVVGRILSSVGWPRGLDLVKATHGMIIGKDWRRLIHDGVFTGAPGAAAAQAAEALDTASKGAGNVGAALTKLADALTPATDGPEVVFIPDSHAWDGRFANSGWMQEMPDPMTKTTWDNIAMISAAYAKKLGAVDGDMLQITVAGKSVAMPAFRQPGLADDTVVVALGNGRRTTGKVGTGVGFDAWPLRSSKAMYTSAATVTRTGDKHVIAQTQEHFAMEGRALVREGNLTKFRKEPDFAKKMVKHPPLLSLFDDYKYDGHKWGMTIDLNSCTGCNACMVACQAENNIPVVGKAGVIKTREMHWIRVDRYFLAEGDESEEAMEAHDRLGDVKAVMQPIPCMQCENAPCEQVCPVGATTHSPEGLNDMAYNRCIGTRYCLNNCPFKVRRFNFFNYNLDIPAVRQLQYNPEVTVRFRGVVEKCTYCVQRIQNAKIDAHREGRERVKDGAIVTACQQVCPTKAITFGDLNDRNSAVAKSAANERNYAMLEELNIRPRTTYLARISNPNSELEEK